MSGRPRSTRRQPASGRVAAAVPEAVGRPNPAAATANTNDYFEAVNVWISMSGWGRVLPIERIDCPPYSGHRHRHAR